MKRLITCMLMLYAVNKAISQNNFVNSCLRYGCTMGSGLHIEDLDGVIGQNLPLGEYYDNVITAATYNIKQGDNRNLWDQRRGELCTYLNRLNAKILSLQEVNEDQLNDLKQCLPSYSSISNPINDAVEEKIYHPIFYQDSGRLSYVNSGSFWLSNTPNISASQLSEKYETRMFQWIRLTFAERKSQIPITTGFGFSGTDMSFDAGSHSPPMGENVFEKMFRLLNLYTSGAKTLPNSPPQPPPLPPPKNAYFDTTVKTNAPKLTVQYRQFDMYVVNGKLNPDNIYVAREEARVLTKHLRHNVMDRRQFPMLLMGDFGHEDDSPLYNVLDRKKWLKNSMASSKVVFPEMTYVKPNEGKESLVDYIWYNRLKSLFSATMTDINEDHRPVFAAFMKRK